MAKEIQITEQEALGRLTLLCSQGEHCQREMLEKMAKWEITDEAQARIMEHLVTERYIDDARYCRAYIHDKMAYSHWGRRKIEQGLWVKGIAKSVSDPLFAEVSKETWVEMLRPQIALKRRQTKGRNAYEINQKLIRFALGRGFSYDEARECIGDEDIDEDC